MTSSATGQLTLAEHYDGAGWQIQPTPNPAGTVDSALAAVSCQSDGSCIAVGNFSTNATNSKTLAESLTGSTWQLQSTPNPSGVFGSFLGGVSCPAATACQAVGYSEPTSTS